MPPELLAGELFGTLQGSEESRPGKLELANGGTLFLDEVEKLPFNIGLELAQALKQGKLRRVGEEIDRNFDVKIIAACDNDLKRLMEKGMFVPELYELLAKTVIKIPALRIRREDIPLLAGHIIEELAVQHHMPVKQLTPQVLQILESYEWPGNVKQLQGVVEQAFFHTAGNTIQEDNISIPGELGVNQAWKEDKALFLEAWKAAGGNVSRLANMLDVSRVTLYRYLKKHGLEKN
jgi:DNA-binding NtrC family response regulator